MSGECDACGNHTLECSCKKRLVIDCISDTHGYFPEMMTHDQRADLLIISGDLTANSRRRQYQDFFNWLSTLDYKKKIFILGNHDHVTISDYQLPSDIEYLHDSGTEFDGLKIWGTPWSLHFSGINPSCSEYTGDEELLKSKYDLIPDDIDILISHTPFWGILDQNMDGYNCGSRSLLVAVDRIKPKLFVCGHIHEIGLEYRMLHGTMCINSSYVDEFYKPRKGFIRCVYQDALFTRCSIQYPMK